MFFPSIFLKKHQGGARAGAQEFQFLTKAEAPATFQEFCVLLALFQNCSDVYAVTIYYCISAPQVG